MPNNRLAILSITIFLTGCFGLFDSGSDHIIGRYNVMWIDVAENQMLTEELEKSSGALIIIEAYVFAIGHNKDFIIAKQHPTAGFENDYKINTNITNYFIVDLNRKLLKGEKNKFGPFTHS